MPRADRLTVYRTMLESGLVPLFYDGRADIATAVATAVADGGARVLELTNRGPGALPVFEAVRAHIDRDGLPLCLGVGSIVDPATAALFVAAGAEFVVGPVLSADVARLCNRRKLAYLPGCATPTEIARAEELGAEIVKIFPATVGGPGFIKAVLGPMPWSRLMPTGGVDESNLTAWFEAGACCVGMGGQLIAASAVADGRFGAISERVERALSAIAACRDRPA